MTPREHECLQLVAQHLSSKEIARRLGLSQHTVDGHLHEARRKLGAPTRRDAVRILLEWEADAPPSNWGGQSEAVESDPVPSERPPPPPEAPPQNLPPPPSSGGQSGSVAAPPPPLSREPSTDDTEEGDDQATRPAGGDDRQGDPAGALPARLPGAAFRYELTPPMRLAAIVVIAAVSALVLIGLLVGSRELTFLIHRMTEGA